MRPAVFPHPAFPDHALLDSGNGLKLERFGSVTLSRPDPVAVWAPRLSKNAWRAADLVFERDPKSDGRAGRWQVGRHAPREARGRDAAWTVRFGEAAFSIRPTSFKHVGLFPEQAANWRFLTAQAPGLGEAPKLLNLFGYTGAATVIAAHAGYRVTHVDASKTSLAWARENAVASGLAGDAVRYLLEDARTFVHREVRRGNRYAGILIDPPHYGRGPKGEKWQLEQHLAGLVAAAGELADERAFVIVSAYAVGLLPTALVNLLEALPGGAVEAGELALPEERVETSDARRLLSCGMCARWTRGLDKRGNGARAMEGGA